jgi:NitT/TauT family transport system substrate-binding protein
LWAQGRTRLIAALESSKVDAAILSDPGVTLLQRKHSNIVLLADTRAPQGTRQAFGSDTYPGAVSFAREQWLRDNRERALGVTTAVLKP